MIGLVSVTGVVLFVLAHAEEEVASTIVPESLTTWSYTYSGFWREQRNPDGFISGRSGYRDSQGKTRFIAYEKPKDGQPKILKDDDKGDEEGWKFLTSGVDRARGILDEFDFKPPELPDLKQFDIFKVLGSSGPRSRPPLLDMFFKERKEPPAEVRKPSDDFP